MSSVSRKGDWLLEGSESGDWLSLAVAQAPSRRRCEVGEEQERSRSRLVRSTVSCGFRAPLGSVGLGFGLAAEAGLFPGRLGEAPSCCSATLVCLVPAAP